MERFIRPVPMHQWRLPDIYSQCDNGESSKSFRIIHSRVSQSNSAYKVLRSKQGFGCNAGQSKFFLRHNYFFDAATRFRSGGQSPIRASSSSPALIGPTPEGVPVNMRSPGSKVRFSLAKATMSATE